MKKLLVIFILFLSSCISNPNLEVYKDENVIYKGYDYISGTNGIKVYQNKDKDISIIDADLKHAGVSFGGVEQKNTSYIQNDDREGFINKIKSGKFSIYDLQSETKETFKTDNFFRYHIKDAFGETNYLKIGDERKTIFAAVNGQFFNANKNPTIMSFPVKSNGKILNSYIDNDKKKKTIVINSNEKVKIIDGYDEKYLLDNGNLEVLVGINPIEDFAKDLSLGRSYIGTIGDDKIVFFIAKSKTQKEMKELMIDYGIDEKDMIMMDGGPSAQFAYYDIDKTGSGINSFYGTWGVPQFTLIYSD